MRKAFFFTLDAIIALVMVTLLTLYIFLTLASIDRTAMQDIELSRISYDLLISMEKNKTLEAAVQSGSSAPFNDFQKVLPKKVCSRFVVYAYPDNATVIAQAPGRCSCSSDLAVVQRSFAVLNRTANALEEYVAEVRSCYA